VAYEFICPVGHAFDLLASVCVEEAKLPTCQQPNQVLAMPPPSTNPTAIDSGGGYDSGHNYEPEGLTSPKRHEYELGKFKLYPNRG